jgi:hypothetical protein
MSRQAHRISDVCELDVDTLERATGGAGFRPATSVDVENVINKTLEGAITGGVLDGGGAWGAILEGAKEHFGTMIEEAMKDVDNAGRPGDAYTPASWDGTDNHDNVDQGGFTQSERGDASTGSNNADTSSENGDAGISSSSSVNFADATAHPDGDGTYTMGGSDGGGGGGFDGGGASGDF